MRKTSSILVAALTTLTLLPANSPASDLASPVVGEERPISEAIDVAAEGHQSVPSAAAGTEGSYAVWTDARLGETYIFGGMLEANGGGKVVGTRLSDEIDPYGSRPAIALGETSYLVVWRGLEEIRGRMINAQGLATGSEFRIGSAFGGEVSLAGGPEGFLVSYLDDSGDLVARRLSESGRLLGDVIDIYDEGTVDHPDVTWGDGTYLVSFLACEDTCRFGARAARVTSDGQVLDPDGLPLTPSSPMGERISAAWDGQRFVVVWVQNEGLFAAEVDPEQRPGSSPSFRLTAAPAAAMPDIAWTGTMFVLTWVATSFEIVTASVKPDLQLSTVPLPVSEEVVSGTRPVLSSDGTTNLLMWDGQASAFGDIFRTYILPNGAPQERAEESVVSGHGQIHPSISAGMGAHLALWQDYRDHAGPIIYGGRIGPGGELLDPAGFRISPETGRHPIAAFNGENWLVVWRQRNRGPLLMGARVSPEGMVLDPSGIPFDTSLGAKEDVAVASDGDGFLLAWSEGRDARVRTLHVSAMGLPATESSIVDESGSDPALTWQGDRYLAVWERSGNIKAAFLGENGELLDAPRRIAEASGYSFAPSVAASGQGSALVSWARCTDDDCETTRVVGRVIANSLDDGIARPLSGAEAFNDEPISVWDGSEFAVVWKHCSDRYDCPDPASYLVYTDLGGAPMSPRHSWLAPASPENPLSLRRAWATAASSSSIGETRARASFPVCPEATCASSATPNGATENCRRPSLGSFQVPEQGREQ